MVIVLFGVSGAGKTTVGKMLAQDLGWRFVDADDFHPPSNIEKMAAGTALDDLDRQDWLLTLRGLIEQAVHDNESMVLACSALKQAYRDVLRVSREVKFVFLDASPELIEKRLTRRKGHFMSARLIESQFDTLEEPGPAELTMDAGLSPEEIVREIRRVIG